MLKIIDKYILKRYLVTFGVMLLLFMPIAIIIDVSEKINKILLNKAPLGATVTYYIDFTIYFANFLFPIFLFLSVIWFTSKLANNTEVIAILSSGISFTRFLRPYIIGASIISILVLLLGFFILPKASQGYNDFRYKYMKTDVKDRESLDVYRQISDSEFIYVSNFNQAAQTGYNFVFEKNFSL
jgi:lipopolysaccharide export system permease protein